MDEKAYFNLYEDRYRRLREQGIDDWINNPAELKSVFRNIDDFLRHAGCEPAKTSIIEFGCGQGHLAKYLLDKGYKYLGVDISESAIVHAGKKAGDNGQSTFLRADITDLKQVNDDSFDIVIDNQCFHMLVTDEHRKRYLAEVKRVLKNTGKIFFHESYRPEESKANISSLQDFIATTDTDYETLFDYTAWCNNETRIIKLPRVPARAKNETGYRKELEKAGFNIDYFSNEEIQCIFYAHKR